MARVIQSQAFSYKLILPQYWPVWIGIGVWAVIASVLPFRYQMLLGGRIGRLMARLNKKRRLIAMKNLQLCFPNLSPEQRQALFWRNMESIGRSIFDSGISWFWSNDRLQSIIEVQGLHHLENAYENGHGVLFIGVHTTSVELGGPGIKRNVSSPMYGVYRAHSNAAFDYIQKTCRERSAGGNSGMVDRQDVRGMIRALRQKAILHYLPDQDYGREHSVFAPFFGIDAATINSAGQLLKLGKAVPLGYQVVRKHDLSGYLVRVFPSTCFEGLGNGDQLEDAKSINRFIEERVAEHPEQYLWVHRRFKTRPDCSDDFYGLKHLKSSVRQQKRRKKQQEMRAKASSK